MLHGGVNPAEMFGMTLSEMAMTHQVIAIHMRGHGFSTDIDAPWSCEAMADDVAAVLGEIGMQGSRDGLLTGSRCRAPNCNPSP